MNARLWGGGGAQRGRYYAPGERVEPFWSFVEFTPQRQPRKVTDNGFRGVVDAHRVSNRDAIARSLGALAIESGELAITLSRDQSRTPKNLVQFDLPSIPFIMCSGQRRMLPTTARLKPTLSLSLLAMSRTSETSLGFVSKTITMVPLGPGCVDSQVIPIQTAAPGFRQSAATRLP